ncbi:hypothetical protein [Halobacillus sp. H74]|uniref:hypothetical protein n=1 Tax=Halobacillus sp. H74 TaxID=3457436 RepID=UPI003FCD6F39
MMNCYLEERVMILNKVICFKGSPYYVVTEVDSYYFCLRLNQQLKADQKFGISRVKIPKKECGMYRT